MLLFAEILEYGILAIMSFYANTVLFYFYANTKCAFLLLKFFPKSVQC